MSDDVPKFVHDTRHIISVNAAACQLFRCEELGLVDLDMMQLIDDSNGMRGLARLRMKMLREHGQINSIAYPFMRCDGSVFWGSVTSRILPDGTFETTVQYRHED